MRIALIVILLLCPATAIGNPIDDGPVGPDGVITVLRPAEAVRYFVNRYSVQPGRNAWKTIPPEAPIADCSWDRSCGATALPESADVRFFRESVTILLDDTSAIVDASYGFREGHRAVAMSFPLPECGWAQLKESNRRHSLVGEDYLPVDTTGTCWRWTLPDEGPGSRSAHIAYEYFREGSNIVYVLSSSLRWSEPIGHAQIEVVIPRRSMMLTNYTFSPRGNDLRREYSMNVSDFAPDRDLVVELQTLHGDPGAVIGRIVDGEEQPLAAIKVALRDMNLGAESDSEGRFCIPGVESGSYTLHALPVDRRGASREIVVLPGDSTEVLVKLFAAQAGRAASHEEGLRPVAVRPEPLPERGWAESDAIVPFLKRTTRVEMFLLDSMQMGTLESEFFEKYRIKRAVGALSDSDQDGLLRLMSDPQSNRRIVKDEIIMPTIGIRFTAETDTLDALLTFRDINSWYFKRGYHQRIGYFDPVAAEMRALITRIAPDAEFD